MLHPDHPSLDLGWVFRRADTPSQPLAEATPTGLEVALSVDWLLRVRMGRKTIEKCPLAG